MRESDHAVEEQRIHPQTDGFAAKFYKGYPRAVRRDSRRESDLAEMRDLVLAIAVVVHHPDFFGAAAITDEDDLALGDAGDTTAEAEDDLVGKLVGNQASVVLSRLLAILFAQHLRRYVVLHVEEPAADSDLAASNTEVAERHHFSAGRWIRPGVDL